jgi:hypothetical protein
MEAARPGKALQNVTDALAQNLDTLMSAVGRVRRAHRLSEAEEARDLFLLGGLHGIVAEEMAVLTTRFAVTATLLAQVKTGSTSPASAGNLWGIAPPGFQLERYAIDQPSSEQKTRARFIQSAGKAVNAAALASALRQRIATITATHTQGNGTIQALAVAAANSLDCDVLNIDHSSDRYFHRAKVRDRLALTFPVVLGGSVVETPLPAAEEEILIEENPLERLETGSDPRLHAQLFPVVRRGFERTLARAVITGTGGRTIGPMLVNRDDGQGVGFAGVVPEGSTLVINEEGRALLDGLDVTSRAFGWKGACFADGSQPHRKDFLFAGEGTPLDRAGRFVEPTPPGSLSASFSFPHAGESIQPLSLDVGENRLAFFVQEGFFSNEQPDGTVERVEPRPAVAFVDASVFAPGKGDERQTAALLSLSWLERGAFRARIWIPSRFLQLTPDDEEGRATRRQVLKAVERFRPAGVRLDVDFIDNRWVLGRGVIFKFDQQPREQGPGIGMELWKVPEEE